MTYKELTKKLTHLEKELLWVRHELVLSAPPASHNRQQAILQKTAGALKNKIKGNLVAWQRRVRAENYI